MKTTIIITTLVTLLFAFMVYAISEDVKDGPTPCKDYANKQVQYLPVRCYEHFNLK